MSLLRPQNVRGSALRRRITRVSAAAIIGGVVAGALATAPVGVSDAVAAVEEGDQASRFTFAVLPDTQFYSRYSSDQFVPRYGTDPFAEQTKWLAANAGELEIPFVAHLGDIVDRVNTEREWVAADNAIRSLDDAAVPYSILAGNHDVLNSNDNVPDDQYDLGAEPFLKWFGPNRAETVSTYQGSDPTGFNQFHIFEAEGQQFMVMALSWRASDATLAWANDVIASHPTVPVILTTHQVINIDTDGTSPLETDYGLHLWENLIRGNDQIFMTLNGHFHGASRLVKTNDFGNDVTQIVMDYQMAYEGGNGYLGLFEFDLTNNAINVQTGSPWVVGKPQESLTSYDQPFLEGPMQQFTLPFTFTERFGGFNPDFTAGTADSPSLSTKARDILLDGFVGPDPVSTEFPGSTADYAEAEGTLAHWRFNGLDGVVTPDVTIPDVAGDNDLHRVDPALTNSEGTEMEDVTIVSGDAHAYSSDGAASCFTNSSGSRYSYLSTAADAPVNNADFSEGYTIESFVKMSPEWTAETNGWSKFVTHTGNRSTIGVPETPWDWTASPTALGISNLREFQYTAVPSDPRKGDRTAWSGEIMVDTWSHVAVINDPEAATITMYVDGAPVLRNATDAVGMTDNVDMPWILGSDWVDDAARNGWNGCIGETRIVDRPTEPTEWMTARADLTGLTVTDAPTGTLPADATVASFSGTGLPGAEVRIDGGAFTSDVVAISAVDESNARALDSVTVDENGQWTYSFPAALAAGEYAYSVTQALGTRASAPIAVEFGIAAVVDPVDPTDPTDPGAPPVVPSDPAGDAAETEADRLARTGTESSPAGILALLALALGGTALAVARLRRGRARS